MDWNALSIWSFVSPSGPVVNQLRNWSNAATDCVWRSWLSRVTCQMAR